MFQSFLSRVQSTHGPVQTCSELRTTLPPSLVPFYNGIGNCSGSYPSDGWLVVQCSQDLPFNPNRVFPISLNKMN